MDNGSYLFSLCNDSNFIIRLFRKARKNRLFNMLFLAICSKFFYR